MGIASKGEQGHYRVLKSKDDWILLKVHFSSALV